MEKKTITSRDGLPITYYKAGAGDTCVLISNALGMSIKFWVPVIQALCAEATVIGLEYRGFPGIDRELTPAECRFEAAVQDFVDVVDAEGIGQFHCVSWCLGSKIALALYRQLPGRVLSIVALNSAHKQLDLQNKGKFSGLILSIRDKIRKDPDALQRMIKIMAQVGAIPTADFLAMIEEEEDDSPSLDLYDFLEAESSLSSLAFYLINTPTGLTNYLNMYEQFGLYDGEETLRTIGKPFVMLHGGKDNVIQFEERDQRLFGANPCIRQHTLEAGSHFMIVEYPKKVARMIADALRENQYALHE